MVTPSALARACSRSSGCVAALRDPRLRRNPSGEGPPLNLPESLRLISHSMILEDNPEHRRLRHLVTKPFTPRAINRLARRVESLTDQLLDELEPRGQVDLQGDYALPIPYTVISDMVGVPEAERHIFADGMRAAGVAEFGQQRWIDEMERLTAYVRDLIDRRRSDPADDILTGLLHAREADDQLTEDEVVSMVFLVITAGYETTYHLITNGVLTLLEHPDQLALLRDDLDLMPQAVEEILRFRGPVGGTKPNFATEEITLHGVTIPEGAVVIPLLLSANRDERVFDHPDSFDIRRRDNDHIAFGHGIHICLGAPLARMETRIALTALIRRNPNLRLAVDPQELSLEPLPFWQRLQSLPVHLG